MTLPFASVVSLPPFERPEQAELLRVERVSPPPERTRPLIVEEAAVAFSASEATLKSGKADLKSAGPLAFGPEGILFVGDSAGD